MNPTEPKVTPEQTECKHCGKPWLEHGKGFYGRRWCADEVTEFEPKVTPLLCPSCGMNQRPKYCRNPWHDEAVTPEGIASEPKPDWVLLVERKTFREMEKHPDGWRLKLDSLPPRQATPEPLGKPMEVVEGREPRVHHESPGMRNGLTRQQRRSITLKGIAEAMAEQEGNL